MVLHFSKSNSYDLVFIFSLISFTLSYKIGDMIFINWYDYISIESVSHSTSLTHSSLFSNIIDDEARKVDIFCRLLVDSTKERIKAPSDVENSNFIFASSIQYAEQKNESEQKEDIQIQMRNSVKKLVSNSIYHLQIDLINFKNFKQTSKDKPKKKKQEEEQDDQMNMREAFNNEALKSIINIYKDALSSKKLKNSLTNLHFSYLTMLATLSLNSCLSFVSILNIKINDKLRLGWKEQQKMQSVMKLTENQSKLNLQRLKKDQEFQLYLILQFEEEMNRIQQQYYECMRLYKIAVEKLSMSFIDINEVYLNLKEYRTQRGILEGKIMKQLQYNSHSETLRNLCINFDFYMLHKSTLFKFYEKLNRISIQQLKTKEYYSKLSCFLYVSLLEKKFGAVQKINRSFVKAFGFANRQQIVGKPIQQILPNNFLKYSSDTILSSVVIEQFLSSYNESYYMPLFIAKNSMGFSIPLQIRIQSQMVDFNDFGLTVWAKPIRDDNLYILLDYKDTNQIKVASKQFYDEFFYDNFNLSQLKNVRIDCLIPVVQDIIKISQTEIGRKFETILIKPQDKFEVQTKPNLRDPNFLNQLRDAELFFVSVSFQSYNTKVASFVNMIIDYYEPIFYLKDKIQYILSYGNQIKEFCGITLEFDPNYQQDILSDMRVKSYNLHDDSSQKRVKNRVSINNTVLLNDSLVQPTHPANKNNHNSTHGTNGMEFVKSSTFKYQDHQNQEQNLNISKVTIKDKVLGLPQEMNSNINIESSLRIDSKFNDIKIQNNNGEESQIFNQISNQPTIEDQQNNNNFQEIYNTKDNQDINSKDLYQNHFQEIYNTKDMQDFTSKEVSHNNLLSTKQNGFQFSAFMTKKYTMQNLNNTTRSQLQPKEKECPTGQESKMPLTQEESKRRNKLEQQSVSSSTKSVLNSYLFEMIHAKKQMAYIKVINLMGILSILVTLSLTFSGFYTFITSLVSQRENFKYINWMYMMNIHISYSFSEYQVRLQNINGYFKTDPKLNNEFNLLTAKENGSRINLTKDTMLMLINNTNPNIEVFNIIKQKTITQNIYYNKQKYDKYDFSLMYSMLQQMAGIYYFVSNQDPTTLIRYQGEINYPSLNEQVQLVISELNQTYQTQLNSIENQSLVQLFVVLSVTFTFLCSILPSYIFTKTKQQKILELLATFDPLSLKEILGQLTYQLGNYQGFDKNQTIASRSNFSGLNQTHISKQAQAQVNIEKKLNISRTSSLIYSIKYLCIGLVLIFGLIMIYPIVNYVIVKKFIENSTIIYDFNNVVCESYFALVNGLRARQGLSAAYLMPELSSQPVSHYQNLFENMVIVYDGLTEKINNNISKVKTSTLYNQQIFDDYLISVFTGNACNTMKNFTQYQNGNFMYDQCNSAGRNNLQKGLLNGLQFFISLFKENYRFIYRYDKAAFQVDYDIYNKNTPGINQFKFKIELSKAHEYLLNFFQDQNLLLYNNYYQISIILVAFQLTFVILIFIISWGYYFKNINSLIYSTKELFDIFPQQVLLQNTYIMSFLRQND